MLIPTLILISREHFFRTFFVLIYVNMYILLPKLSNTTQTANQSTQSIINVLIASLLYFYITNWQIQILIYQYFHILNLSLMRIYI